MAVPDWLGFPRKEDGWHTRANAWMNEMRGCVNTNTTNIATNTSDISTNTSDISTNTSDISTNTSDISTINTNLGTWGTWTPTWTGITAFTSSTFRYRNSGGTVELWIAGVISTLGSTFITFTVPVNIHASLYGETGSIGGSVWGEDVSSSVRYEGVPRADNATTISIRYPHNTTSSTTAWHGNSPSQPFAWASTDRINAALWYEPA